MYYIKAYTLLAKRLITGGEMPFHSKRGLHDGVWNTVKMIASGKCRLHWLRG